MGEAEEQAWCGAVKKNIFDLNMQQGLLEGTLKHGNCY